MGRFSTLGTAVSGLNAAQTGLYVTGHNMANVDTIGFTRQQAMQADFASMKIGQGVRSVSQVGLGTDISETRQIRNRFLDISYRREAGKHDYYDIKAKTGYEIEHILGDLQSDYNTDTVMKDLFNSLQDLSIDTQSLAARGTFISTAVTFIDKVSNVYNRMIEYQDNLNEQVKGAVIRVNQLITSIDNYNKLIMANEVAGDNANDYRDARAVDIDELSHLLGIEYKENVNGTVTIFSEGKELCSDGARIQLGLRYTGPNNSLVEPVITTQTEILQWDADAVTLFNFTKPINSTLDNDSGKLKSLMVCRGFDQRTYADAFDAARPPILKRPAETVPEPAEILEEPTQTVDRPAPLNDANQAEWDAYNANVAEWEAHYQNLADWDAYNKNRIRVPQPTVTLAEPATTVNRPAQPPNNANRAEWAEYNANMAEWAAYNANMADWDIYNQNLNRVPEPAETLPEPLTRLDRPAPLNDANQAEWDAYNENAAQWNAYNTNQSDWAEYGANQDEWSAYSQNRLDLNSWFDSNHSFLPRMMKEFDTIVNKIVSMINDSVAPHYPTVYLTDNSGLYVDADGNVLADQNDETLRVLAPDSDKMNLEDAPYDLNYSNTGGVEIFVRRHVDRFTGDTYNKEYPDSYFTLYTSGNLMINPKLLEAGGYNLIALMRVPEPDDPAGTNAVNGISDNTVVLDDLLAQWKSKIVSVGGGEKLSIDDAYRQFTNILGVETSESANFKDEQAVLLVQVDNKRQTISAVSLDEEMRNMMMYQHAYNAAARVVNVVDSMIDKIVNGTGRVGL